MFLHSLINASCTTSLAASLSGTILRLRFSSSRWYKETDYRCQVRAYPSYVIKKVKIKISNLNSKLILRREKVDIRRYPLRFVLSIRKHSINKKLRKVLLLVLLLTARVRVLFAQGMFVNFTNEVSVREGPCTNHIYLKGNRLAATGRSKGHHHPGNNSRSSTSAFLL